MGFSFCLDFNFVAEPKGNKQLLSFSAMGLGFKGERGFKEPWPLGGVYRCLGVFIGVVNTVKISKGYELFRFAAPRGGVFRCLLEKEG